MEMLGTMLEYHYWANRRTLEAVEVLTEEQFNRDLGASYPSVRATLAHLLYAEATWLGRLTGRPFPAPTPADVPDVAAARRLWGELERELRAYIGGLSGGDLERTIRFKTSSGKEFVHPVREVLLHLFNHGTYHRGQVSAMLRQLGAAAKGTDLILYFREQSGQLS